MARECQEKNAKGLTMVAVGMNKSGEELMILDEHTRADLASGKYHDQRRGSFGTSAPATAPGTSVPAAAPGGSATDRRPPDRGARRRLARRTSGPAARGRPWTDRQERLALLYNEQGLRPDEIAARLGVSTYTATQIILAARSRH
jgi:hypothetical protein